MNNFKIQSDIESIQHNPGMYIGSTEEPTHLFSEVFDNALDECLANYATSIHVKLHPDGSCSVSDNGRGIVTGKYELDGVKKEIPVWICTKLFSGEKFDQGAYKIHIGMHGIGLCAVNALSEKLAITIYHNGAKTSHLVNFEDATLTGYHRTRGPAVKGGTLVYFKPSKKYFESTTFDEEKILARMKLAKLFHPGINMFFNDQQLRQVQPEDFFWKTPDSKMLKTLTVEAGSVKCYLTYDLASSKSNVTGSVNLIPTVEGTHYRAMRNAICDIWKECSGQYDFKYEDALVGIQCVFLVYVEELSFTSQTKRELSVRSSIIQALFKKFKKELRKKLKANEKRFTLPCLEKFQAYRESLTRLGTLDYLKKTVKYGGVAGGKVSRSQTVKQLYDCSSTDVASTELFIVEGESAGGSILQCRDPKIHAVLPLRGKTLNAATVDLDKILRNAEFCALINSMGCGVHPQEDVTKLRYGKIILLADADPDGKQINALLLGAFSKLLPQLVEAGHLYTCFPPLYKQNGTFIWDEKKLDKTKPFFRFKGLGEMNPEELHAIAIDPATRVIEKSDGSPQDIKDTISVVGNSDFRNKILVQEGVL